MPLFAAVGLGRQLLNAVQLLMGDNNSVHVQGEGLMEVIAWETELGFAVHMLNYSRRPSRGKHRFTRWSISSQAWNSHPRFPPGQPKIGDVRDFRRVGVEFLDLSAVEGV
jgi:hypothetical protein